MGTGAADSGPTPPQRAVCVGVGVRRPPQLGHTALALREKGTSSRRGSIPRQRCRIQTTASQLLDAIETGETTVEGAEGDMTGLPGNLQHKAV